MKKIAIIGNREKPGLLPAVEQVQRWAATHSIEITSNLSQPFTGDSSRQGPFGSLDDEVLRASFAGCDAAITFGGDGTLLYGARVLAPLEIPLLAVNLGSLGFHTQAEPADLLACLDALKHGKYRTERRLLLEARVEDSEGGNSGKISTITALNDIVIAKSAWGHMVHLRLHIDGEPATDVSADGLVIASPTGSSAYNYAADGPVLHPGMESMVINAICPHRMRLAPLVLPAESQIRVEFHARLPLDEAQLLVDGQAWRTVSHSETLKISRASVYLPLVVFKDDFYQKLREKLRWGGLL